MGNISRNLLLTKDDIVKLADLGEAKNLSNTVDRTYVGTIQYMSPEQSQGRQFDEQLGYTTHIANTDIWFVIHFSCFFNNTKL